MSLQDALRGMLYSGKTVSHQNAAIYLSKNKKKVTTYKESAPQGEFIKLWKESKDDIIRNLQQKLPLSFDYVVSPEDNSLLLYLKPADNTTGTRQLKSNALIDFEPEGQISITPIIDEKTNMVTAIAVQSKYTQVGEDYNKRTMNLTAFELKIPELIDQITRTAVTLSKNLNIIQ